MKSKSTTAFKLIVFLFVFVNTSEVLMSSNLFRNEKINIFTNLSYSSSISNSSSTFGTLTLVGSSNTFRPLSLTKSIENSNNFINSETIQMRDFEAKKVQYTFDSYVPISQYVDPNIQAKGRTDAVVSKALIDGLTGAACGVLFYYLTDKNTRGTIGPWIGVGAIIGVSWGVLF